MADLSFAQAVDNLWGMKSEILKAAWETCIMMGISVPVSVLFGTLLGIGMFATGNHMLFYNRTANKVLDNVINLIRAFPFVILMVAMGPLTLLLIGKSIGPYAASLILSVSGMFYFARLVEQNLREVPRGIIEAATSMGASPTAIIFKVLLSEARSGMVLSITVLSIGILSYSAAAGMIGGGGLGDLAVRYGYHRFQTDMMVFIVAVLVLAVIVIQSLGNLIARKLDKR
ncbi:methionine ABC transporter permease [Neisseria canis]|uniref:ABC transporter permease n=1 Tax=Neisseria canis TaxID=493 RepID=A0A1X3CSP1_9NEIS|nr:methionine ABC transporter permease [Neisseria canis]OSI10566.1 methionine ABC transporter ATP-binding protein [Neisseria canis]VEE98840.1 ABC transporter permease [Neisseria canis]